MNLQNENKATWKKQYFQIHDTEEFLSLAEKFGCKGFVVYDFLTCFLGKQNIFEIDRDSKKYKVFITNLNILYDISFDEIETIIDFLIQENIIQIVNRVITINELKETFNQINQAKEQRINAGKASAEKRKKQVEQKQNLKIETKDFNKNEIEGFEGTFSTVEKAKLEETNIPSIIYNETVTDSKGYEFKNLKTVSPENKAEWDIFSEMVQLGFDIIPEEPFTNKLNKQEKKALFYLRNFIDEGYVKKFQYWEDFLNTELFKIKTKGNPSFYFSSFYEVLIQNCLTFLNDVPPDPFWHGICNKYKTLKQMPEIN